MKKFMINAPAHQNRYEIKMLLMAHKYFPNSDFVIDSDVLIVYNESILSNHTVWTSILKYLI